MSNLIGKTLGHYEITGPLGAGGMGEVFRARDTRLDRDVAVKVLPKHLSAHPEVRARFEREARVISSLSHNHICTLFDIGSHDGVDFLAMEYLEGETLDERLKRGPLPLEEALVLGRQIADALDVAHRNGVIHRDLKPGNIMLTTSGAKLLDFGLAKSRESTSAGEPDLTTLPTEADRPLTRQGAILGTLQYMAPEQLEGKDVDARADIFGLGLLLYEMVSGQRAFDGDSQASLIAAIMSSQPPDMFDVAPVTPRALERIVSACLQKNPNERIQSAHDVKLQLEWIRESDEDLPVAAASIKPGSSVVPWILVAALGLTAAWFAISGRGPAETRQETTRLSVSIPPSLRLVPEPVDISVSPDGSMVSFVAADSTGTQQLWIRRLDDLEPYSLPDTDGAYAHFWSPDSQHLAYFIDGSMLRVEASGDRPPRVICDVVSGRGGTWNEDDLIVYAGFSAGPLLSVPASGGEPTQITTLDEANGETAHRYPTFLPDGRHYLYLSIIGTERLDTRVASIDGGESTHLITADGIATYAEPGYLVYEMRNAMLASPFDAETLEITGSPIDLNDRPGGDRNYFGSMAAKFLGDTMLYISYQSTNDLVWFDRAGARLGSIPVPPDDYLTPVLSPDGSRVVVEKVNQQRIRQLWIIELDRNILAPVTTQHDSSFPSWTFDGQAVAYGSRRGGTRNVYMRSDRGYGPETELVRMDGMFADASAWSRDGRHILIRQLDAETLNDILIYSLDDDTVEPFLATRHEEGSPAISRDGKWIAYQSDESGRAEVYVQSFPDLRFKMQVSIGGCGSPADGRRWHIVKWGPDGDEILYLGSDSYSIMRVPIETEPRVRAGRPELLFRMPQGSTWFDTVDAERFLVTIRADQTQELVVVDNWAAELATPN